MAYRFYKHFQNQISLTGWPSIIKLAFSLPIAILAARERAGLWTTRFRVHGGSLLIWQLLLRTLAA